MTVNDFGGKRVPLSRPKSRKKPYNYPRSPAEDEINIDQCHPIRMTLSDIVKDEFSRAKKKVNFSAG